MNWDKIRVIEISYDKWYVMEETNATISYEYYAPSMFISQNYRVVIKRNFNNIYEINGFNSDDGRPWAEWKISHPKVKNELLKDAKEVFSKMKPLKEVTKADLIDLED
jgi:hypothetical protein